MANDLAVCCNGSNASDFTDSCSGDAEEIDLPRAVSLLVIFVVSLIGNVCTIAIVISFRTYKFPDLLVAGLACNDLIATLIPVMMTLYSYFSLEQFEENSIACNFYGTIAQHTRYAAVFIVTLISVERYVAVNRPFLYRKHATPLKCIVFLLCGCFMAFTLAIAPALDKNTRILSHDGFCLFDFTSPYAYSLIVYTGIQFIIVLVCFVLVMTTLFKVYRRRKRLQVHSSYEERSKPIHKTATTTTHKQPSRCRLLTFLFVWIIDIFNFIYLQVTSFDWKITYQGFNNTEIST